MSIEMKQTRDMMQKTLSKAPSIALKNPKLMRAGMEKFLSMNIPKDVAYVGETIQGIEVECVTPPLLDSNDIIFYMHGGAFTTGNVHSSRNFAAQLAKACKKRVYTLSYRLAPEHPYPAALDDSFCVYKELLSRYPDQKIFLTGESAGGTLCLTVTQRALSENIRIADAIMCNSPATDLANVAENINPKDLLVGDSLCASSNKAYFQDAGLDPTLPGISPYYGSFDGFPTIVFTCDRDETFCRDTNLVYQKCLESGVDTQLFEFTGTFHAFATTSLAKGYECRMMMAIADSLFQ